MVGLMEESTKTIIKTWESRILESEEGIVDITIDEDLKSLSADIISRACFGSSYSQGNQIFAKIAALQDILSHPSLLFGFLNFRFVCSSVSNFSTCFFIFFFNCFFTMCSNPADSFPQKMTRR